jgi:hypothetical protein
MIEDVYVITYCRSMDLFYGTSLFLETIRVGFPKSNILIIDNGSIPEAVLHLKNLASKCNAKFNPISERPHWLLIQNMVMTAKRPFAIVDPDVIFWEKMDDLDAIVSGRLIPNFIDPFSECITKERLHTSLLKFSDPQHLQSLTHSVRKTKFEWQPFQPTMIEVNGKWIRYDTAAVLYSSIKPLSKPFSKKELDSYDHLFCGSHLDQVLPKMGPFGEVFLEFHNQASKGNLSALKGIWKIQEKFFELQSLK